MYHRAFTLTHLIHPMLLKPRTEIYVGLQPSRRQQDNTAAVDVLIELVGFDEKGLEWPRIIMTDTTLEWSELLPDRMLRHMFWESIEEGYDPYDAYLSVASKQIPEWGYYVSPDGVTIYRRRGIDIQARFPREVTEKYFDLSSLTDPDDED